MSNNVKQAIKNTKTRSKRTRNHQKQLSSRALILGFFSNCGRLWLLVLLTLRKLCRDDVAIRALLGFLRQTRAATRLMAGRAFKTVSRPFVLAPGAFIGAVIEVLAVGRQTLRPLEAKIDHCWLDHHAQVALRLERREHSLDRIELSDVLLNPKDIATSIECPPQVATSAKPSDNDSVTRFGKLTKDPLRKIHRLLGLVDFFPFSVDSSLAHLGPNDEVVALQRIRRHVEVLGSRRRIPLKPDDSHFCGGEERTRRPRHLVIAALVPSQHLNILEIEVHHNLFDEGKLERVAPHDYGDQGLCFPEKKEPTKEASQRILG